MKLGSTVWPVVNAMPVCRPAQIAQDVDRNARPSSTDEAAFQLAQVMQCT
jgi:hypothetical protein